MPNIKFVNDLSHKTVQIDIFNWIASI